MRRERIRPLLAVVVVGLVLPVSACSFGGAAKCEKAFTAAALSVAGVTSAAWDCSESFGGGWQRADVVVEATTKDEAIAVMDAALKVFAASPDLENGWSTPQEYKTQDRSIIVGANDLGFNGTPNVGDVREHYGITPG